ncbi:MAG: 3-deoxy-manno-octulosonate cytidylyltransferase [Alphaproteobacteria bacterium]|nr:3-deoxy-manno-octulosonate cytidylyltransferase [Alphaproteobacteria bacterium]
MVTVSVWIPARLASERLPRKMLADIDGEPLIVRVWRQAEAAEVGPVYVAAADTEIVDIITRAGGRAILTDPALPSGSDRVCAASEGLGADLAGDWLINLQGDMPYFPAAYLRRLAGALDASVSDAVTLCAPLTDERSRVDPAVVKAAAIFTDASDPAEVPVPYFSRAPVPWTGDPADLPLWGHIGVYAWRRESLRRFVALPPSPLETRERLEQLRALEAGMSISALLVDTMPDAIDTAEDLERARGLTR